jgi:hypothetical protein
MVEHGRSDGIRSFFASPKLSSIFLHAKSSILWTDYGSVASIRRMILLAIKTPSDDVTMTENNVAFAANHRFILNPLRYFFIIFFFLSFNIIRLDLSIQSSICANVRKSECVCVHRSTCYGVGLGNNNKNEEHKNRKCNEVSGRF